MRSLALALMLSLGACSFLGTSVDNSVVSLEHEHPEASRVQGWIQFPALSMHSADQAAAPVPPFLRGEFVGGWFTPRGSIEGMQPEAPARRVLTRGVLELSTRAFIGAGNERASRGPFVVGVQDQETGGFHPLEQPQPGKKP